MRRFRPFAFAVMLLLPLLATGCGSEPQPVAAESSATSPPATAIPDAPPEPTAVSEAALATTPYDVLFKHVFDRFGPQIFSKPTQIDNEWFPLQPGTRWVYEGATEERGFTIPHRIVFTVTDLTKVINGVPAVVAWVEDYSDELLVEAELAFYAQDDEGNVWYLGEYPEVYERGRLVEAPAWLAGLKGAKAGIVMNAAPTLGMPTYSQGWGPAVNWTDYANVDEAGAQTCVVLQCYDDVLVIAESSLEEVDAFQLKYYARGAGNVRVGWRGQDATRETLELVELLQLTPEEMAQAREAALALERQAYEVSPEVYGVTQPAQ